MYNSEAILFTQFWQAFFNATGTTIAVVYIETKHITHYMKTSIIIATTLICVFALNANAQQGRVGRRQANQQRRIENGVNNGSLNPNETQRLESQEGRIQQQKRADKAVNGGRLNGQEKKQINREQNRESQRIYRKKHNGR